MSAPSMFLQITQSVNVDGWTKNDLIYIWKDKGALQFAGKLLLQIILQPLGENDLFLGENIQFLQET